MTTEALAASRRSDYQGGYPAPASCAMRLSGCAGFEDPQLIRESSPALRSSGWSLAEARSQPRVTPPNPRHEVVFSCLARDRHRLGRGILVERHGAPGDGARAFDGCPKYSAPLVRVSACDLSAMSTGQAANQDDGRRPHAVLLRIGVVHQQNPCAAADAPDCAWSQPDLRLVAPDGRLPTATCAGRILARCGFWTQKAQLCSKKTQSRTRLARR
jgi:hypothetical protein